MKKICISIIIFILCIFIFFQSYFLRRTRNGDFYGYFKKLPRQELPVVLTSYLKRSHIPYGLYRMPNYVVDFLKYDEDFKRAYASGKYIVIVFPNEKKDSKHQSLDSFYKELSVMLSEYKQYFNFIIRNEKNIPHYVLTFDQDGYKELRSHCKHFCVINPAKNTMFVFSHMTDSEKEALEVLMQQYSFSSGKFHGLK